MIATLFCLPIPCAVCRRDARVLDSPTDRPLSKRSRTWSSNIKAASRKNKTRTDVWKLEPP